MQLSCKQADLIFWGIVFCTSLKLRQLVLLHGLKMPYYSQEEARVEAVNDNNARELRIIRRASIKHISRSSILASGAKNPPSSMRNVSDVW